MKMPQPKGHPMNWAKFVLTVVVSGIAVSLTDWFFFGVLFHDKYNAYPEVWRASQAGTKGVWIAIGFFTCAVFIYALSLIHISEPTRLGMISYAVFCLK